MIRSRIRRWPVAAVLLTVVVAAGSSRAGNLEPPGPVGPTMKPLDELSAAWVELITSVQRFQIVMNGEAALDKETGLVWDLTPSGTASQWGSAVHSCFTARIGGRGGWRPPTVEELTSLAVPSGSGGWSMPTGHPFVMPAMQAFWSITSSPTSNTAAYYLTLEGVGAVYGHDKLDPVAGTWCVRGGRGPDPMPYSVN